MGKRKKKRKDREDRKTVKEFLSQMGENAAEAVRRTMGNIHQNIFNVVGDVGNAAKWLALAPLRLPMTIILKRRGIPVPKKIDEIAEVFFTHVIHGQKFEEYFSRKQLSLAGQTLGRHSAKMRGYFLQDHFAGQENFAIAGTAAAVMTTMKAADIVQKIVAWFKARRDARAAGGQLPADEVAALNEYDKGLTKGSDGTDERATTDDDDGEGSKVNLWAIIIGALVLVAIIAVAMS